MPSPFWTASLIANSRSLAARCVSQAWSSKDEEHNAEGGPAKNGATRVKGGDETMQEKGELSDKNCANKQKTLVVEESDSLVFSAGFSLRVGHLDKPGHSGKTNIRHEERKTK